MSSPEPFVTPRVAIVGGGPAGLRAAEVLAGAGCAVALYEQKASVGRKFLIAGRGGLNLTHSEPAEAFAQRYETELPRWRELLAAFGPEHLRAWATELGIETYVGTSGRVFPVGRHAAALLRRWVTRLRERGVAFHVSHRLEALAWRGVGAGWTLQMRDMRDDNAREIAADAVVLALGGASWPETGSDGTCTETLRELGVTVAAWEPANCGFDVHWTPELLTAAEGLPLKNIAVRAGGRTVAGEALITRYGIEGGAIYQLSRRLRAMMPGAEIEIDLKPSLSVEQLVARMPGGVAGWEELARAWKLGPAARALLEFQVRCQLGDQAELARQAKGVRLLLAGPRPIAEAISSAGGVEWRELTADLMVERQPGLFVAGEMIDWEAPTGGYLLQGCFATGTRAAEGALRFLGDNPLRCSGGL